MHTAILLVGSNDGDRLQQLRLAQGGLSQFGNIVALSAVYHTAAWGLEGLPAHLNQALALETDLQPQELLTAIQGVEDNLGRIRQERWGLRSIDIDIIFYDDKVLATRDLIIPHALVAERRFALVPLADIVPDYVHPLRQKTVLEMMEACKDKLSVDIYLGE